MKKRTFAVIAILIISLLISACGSNNRASTNNNSSIQENQINHTPVQPQRRAASTSEFKNALYSVGYLEESDFDAKYASIIATNGYNSKALYDSAKTDGVVG